MNSLIFAWSNLPDFNYHYGYNYNTNSPLQLNSTYFKIFLNFLYAAWWKFCLNVYQPFIVPSKNTKLTKMVRSIFARFFVNLLKKVFIIIVIMEIVYRKFAERLDINTHKDKVTFAKSFYFWVRIFSCPYLS